MVPEPRACVQPPRHGAAVTLSALGALLCSLDSALNVAFPAISADLGVSPRQIALVIVFYHVPIGTLTIVGGLLGDRFGHRRVFACGVWATALAFPLCGLAPDYAWLLAARVVQGAGTGLVYGTAPALVTLGLVPARRGLALGVMNFAAGAGLAIAPLIAGVLVDAFGWRAVFLFRVPLAVAVGVASRFMGAVERPAETLGRSGGAPPRAASRDVRGQARTALVLGNALAVVANAASFAIYVFVPYYLIDVAHHPATIAGVIFMTVPLSTSLGGLAGGWLTRRTRPHHLVPVGLALETVGLCLITTLGDASPIALMVSAFVLTGFGLGLFQVPNMALVMALLPDRSQGFAGGMISAMRTVGVLGAALLSPWLFAARQATHRATIADPSALFAAAFSDTFLACTLVAALGLALAIVLHRRAK